MRNDLGKARLADNKKDTRERSQFLCASLLLLGEKVDLRKIAVQHRPAVPSLAGRRVTRRARRRTGARRVLTCMEKRRVVECDGSF